MSVLWLPAITLMRTWMRWQRPRNAILILALNDHDVAVSHIMII